ncbi:uncharacterized protein L969DRAFT_20165 [Mixia osmundae IAM 14324]|uniref:uncharacterized protein n=1 Tax=Mixia osmundae (strain CBS 9802 / IAM 14324 / JCM 22182 / KY 12970) TaxID=764103 RepID=UPI0004A55155|nr:uncharacterized protein L969DRAFT_20165 [Mixia osmundae IAM 14324]KEI36425.1 hypothetical protein L969DRAFT_20165 [Mixia osmundae IAM 14324]
MGSARNLVRRPKHIEVPLDLLLRYQDEEDDTVLPASSHPSYIYGNPYGSSLSRTVGRAGLSTTLQPHLAPSTLHQSRSLATNLPALTRPNLRYQARVWNEQALEILMPFEEAEEPAGAASAVNEEGQDGQLPQGQNGQDNDRQDEAQGDEEMINPANASPPEPPPFPAYASPEEP